MEKFKLGLRSLAQESSSESGAVDGSGASDQALVLMQRAPRGMVSIWTCSKVCAFTFAAGVVVGFMLERRFKRWLRKLLK
ncbi:hypothetical protein IHE45_12G089300 [Dioscorea alata]|uniref:Uncharacterized protein n=3 Tax=Dioscorea alata TaxID=55571 RepID=A0ACB7V421_DIOAL|nr:hypothetical protein IHE45_12G089300 [Dioscorea alata]KAH7667893.1 hypothetical protein IHE45_12G089300 [Dioscorea alata]KAH7667894.1 hypothetical protein IHE45_12G089300 [Dioscorea alata]